MGEIGRTTQRSTLQSIAIHAKHWLETIHCRVLSSSQVEAMADCSCTCESRDATETEKGEFPIKGIRFKNAANWGNSLLVIVQLASMVDLVKRTRLAWFTIRSCKVYSYWHVDKPATSEVFNKWWFVNDSEIFNYQNSYGPSKQILEVESVTGLLTQLSQGHDHLSICRMLSMHSEIADLEFDRK